MKLYKPSNQLTTTSLLWLTSCALIGGITIGSITYLISLLFYLIILFPLGMALAGGCVITTAVRAGKVRHPIVATLFGALTGLSLYTTIHGAEYWHFKHVIATEITEELGQTDSHQIKHITNAYLQDQTGSSGFLGYVKYSAQQGISIGKFGSEGINLGETGTWLYRLIEFSVIDIMIVCAAYAAAKDPFCESCNQWYENTKRLGSVDPQISKKFLNLLEYEQFEKAGQLLDTLSEEYVPSLDVQLQHCSGCSPANAVLTVSSTSVDNKGNIQLTPVTQGMLSPRQSHTLQKAMAGTPQSPPREKPTPVNQEISPARKDSFSVSVIDQLIPHNLNKFETRQLVEQLSLYTQIEKAYLVRKSLQDLSEKPFYILAILPQTRFMESEQTERKLLINS